MINIHHEHILIFQKGDKPAIFYGRNPLTEDEVKGYCWSVWELQVSGTKDHPAPFPDAIPERLIKMYSYEGEVILDPFLGSGTCTKMAKNLKRHSIGIEVNAQYLPLIYLTVGDARIIRYDKGETIDSNSFKTLISSEG
jgi:site-specific DNA-methyltransferase (adenine-specific)